ncbi:MAG: hydroxyacylglutathione hydrolase [SAR86 cluster bacterium]|uniref:Hydroxyacylglutathione hydrolase n=1 Tax=SAR86 cluster bacterium TaxID=2030880 RepID=A0A368BNZ7_9GAMM|nr:MAG: hydroxyacylglutathione hydrolase [SAR86 cluster bacterium]|tara:strand:+ start:5147 stop:5878 length:732 start_codon:yes stop_codon:yes gene_type:complete
MKIFHIPAFIDNYIWSIEKEGKISVIDPGDANAVLNVLQNRNLELEDILITHHHYDHTGGVKELKKVMQGNVYGPDNLAIEGIDVALIENDQFSTLGYEFNVIETPGHTLDHISFHCHEKNVLFCGDTLFSGGCGRLFEGTYQQLFNSLQKLVRLPNDTEVYCTHEYTLANLAFAEQQISDEEISNYKKNVEVKLNKGEISLPSSIEIEKKINLFLMQKTPSDLKHLSPEESFKELRIRKDNF